METKKQKTSIRDIILIILFVFVVGLFSVFFFSEYKYSGCMDCVFRDKESDSKTELPNNIKVVYSEVENRYCVKIENYNDREYLCLFRYGFSTCYEPYDTFRDSISAKVFALEYLDQEKEEKNIKKSYK